MQGRHNNLIWLCGMVWRWQFLHRHEKPPGIDESCWAGWVQDHLHGYGTASKDDSGQQLKDASFTMEMTGPLPVTISSNITNRKVEALEKVTTPAGTFDCVKVSYDLNCQGGDHQNRRPHGGVVCFWHWRCTFRVLWQEKQDHLDSWAHVCEKIALLKQHGNNRLFYITLEWCCSDTTKHNRQGDEADVRTKQSGNVAPALTPAQSQ